jgi:small subunit ribosomal protein S8e
MIYKSKLNQIIMVTKKGKKITGGKYIKQRKKKKNELAGQKRVIKMSDEEKRKSSRVMGGNKKTYMLKAKFVNVRDNGKTSKLEITKVVETPSNTFLARQNIITKGTIIETSKGKVRVTNRPTQEGSVNGVLVKE